jgi:hypothetical protein
MMGAPMPITYRDIRDEAQRCVCSLPVERIELLLTSLDDEFLSQV